MCAASIKSGQKTAGRTAKHLARLRVKAEKTAVKVAEGAADHIEENLVAKVHKIRDIRLLILEWSLTLIAIILLAIIQSFWFSDSYSAATFSSGGSYVEGTLGSVDSLNPLFATTNSEKALSRLLFATLTASDYSGHVGLGLASSVTSDSTGKVWTVRLRQGLTWSDGEPITPQDVIFTVGLIQSPRLSTVYSTNLAGVKVSLAEDDSEAVIFTLPAAYADFSSALTIPILPEHILKDVEPGLLLENDFSQNPVTSGPFTYNATQISANGESVVYLSANPSYYGGRPLLSSFAIHSFASVDDIIAALNAGSITATAEIESSRARELSFPGFYEKQTTISSGVYLFFNTSSDIFKGTSGKAVRQAVRLGIDMPSIRESILGDEPALDYPILKSQIDLNTWPALPTYDLESAKAALANYNGQEISLITKDSGYFPAIAEALKASLTELGFVVNLETYPADQITTIIPDRTYDLLLYEIELGADPDLFVYYHPSQIGKNGLNLSDFNSSFFKHFIESARSTVDPTERNTYYSSFINLWVDEVPAIGIYQVNISYFLNHNVRAFSEDDTLIYPVDRFMDVETWSATKVTKYRTP